MPNVAASYSIHNIFKFNLISILTEGNKGADLRFYILVSELPRQ